jgi:hypothetical protein
MIDLNKIKLGYSALSKEIMLFRHGKDKDMALDKRVATKDVHAAIIEYMLDGDIDATKGVEQVVRFGDRRFRIVVERMK